MSVSTSLKNAYRLTAEANGLAVLILDSCELYGHYFTEIHRLGIRDLRPRQKTPGVHFGWHR